MGNYKHSKINKDKKVIYKNLRIKKYDDIENYENQNDDVIKSINLKETKYNKYIDIEIHDKEKYIWETLNFILRMDKESDIFNYAARLKNPIKEITESGSIIKYLYYKVKYLNQTNVIAYVISDGIIGLTGYMLLIFSRWRKIISFDPIVKEEKNFNHLHNQEFNILSKYDNDIEIIDSNNETIFIIGVHSHGNTQLLFDRMKEKYNGQKYFIIIIPCCVPKDALMKSIEPNDIYIDRGMIGHFKTIYFYEGIF